MINYKFTEEDKELSDQELYLKIISDDSGGFKTSGYGIMQDETTRLINIFRGNPICGRCTGTGNELFERFRKCSDCGGDGIKKIKEFKSLEDL